MADWNVTKGLADRFGFDFGVEHFKTSTGWTNKYVDGFALITESPVNWRQYFQDRIEAMGYPVPVCTGRSGALLLGLLGRGMLVNLRGPEEGPEILSVHAWTIDEVRRAGVVLMDDICFTHRTLDRLRGWADARDLEVRGELVALPYMNAGELTAECMTTMLRNS